jgi:nucleoid-associated protein YgaU
VNRPASRLPVVALSVAIVAAAAMVPGCGCSKAPQVKGTMYVSDGQRAVAKGHIRRAIVCFEKEIELNPDNPVPYLKLALIYEHLYEDPAKADHYYEQYLEKETNEIKRERVEGWRKQLDEEIPTLTTPTSPSPERSESADAALREELEATRKQLSEAKKSNDEFAKRVIELEGIRDQLETTDATAKRLTKERDDLKTQVQTQAESLASLQKAFDDLKTEHDTLSQDSSKEIARLDSELTALKARNKDLEAERSRAGRRSLSNRLDEAREALKAAEDKNAEYARQVEELQKTIAQLKAAGSAVGNSRRTTTHVVQEGETLRTISMRYYGTKERWQDIYRANQTEIANPDEIRAGQELIIPLDDSP